MASLPPLSQTALRVAYALALATLFAVGARAETIRAHGSQFALGSKDKFSALLGRRFLARCRMDWCRWVLLRKIDRVAKSNSSELYHVTTKWWTSGPHRPSYAYPARITFDYGQDFYILCSKTIPAFIRKTEGGWKAFLLAPGTGLAGGPLETVYAGYWATCHRAATTEAARDDEFAKRFGYELAKPDPDHLELRDPRELLDVTPATLEALSEQRRWHQLLAEASELLPAPTFLTHWRKLLGRAVAVGHCTLHDVDPSRGSAQCAVIRGSNAVAEIRLHLGGTSTTPSECAGPTLSVKCSVVATGTVIDVDGQPGLADAGVR